MRMLRWGQTPRAASGAGEGIAREEMAGLAYMFWGRLVALGMLALWVALTLPFERSGLYPAAIAAFALLGAAPDLLARWGLGGTLVTAAFLLLDAGILTYILIVPPPFFVEGWTPQLNLRLPNFLYLGVFLVGMALSYSPACDLNRHRLDRRLERRRSLGRRAVALLLDLLPVGPSRIMRVLGC